MSAYDDDEIFGIDRRKAIITRGRSPFVLLAVGRLPDRRDRPASATMTRALEQARPALVRRLPRRRDARVRRLHRRVSRLRARRRRPEALALDGDARRGRRLRRVRRRLVGRHARRRLLGAQKAGDEPHRAARRVLALNTLEWGVLATLACAAARRCCSPARWHAPVEMELAWLVIVPVCVAAAAWVSSPVRAERFTALPGSADPLTRDPGTWVPRLRRGARIAFADAIGGVVLVRHVLRQSARATRTRSPASPSSGPATSSTMYAALRAFDAHVGARAARARVHDRIRRHVAAASRRRSGRGGGRARVLAPRGRRVARAGAARDPRLPVLHALAADRRSRRSRSRR